MLERYKTVYRGKEGEIIEKKSRFIADVKPVESEAEATAFLESIRKKYWDCRHHCSAFTIGENNEITRCSDDGEPSGTAGRPILDIILGMEIHNVCVVVSRYFGGTLLGTGGLVRAYTQATQAAIAAAERVTVSVCVDIVLRIAYPLYDQAVRIASDCGAKTLDTQYADAVTMTLRMLDGTQEPLLAKLTELCHGQEEVTVSKPLNAVF